jgi:hypothetical protein
MKSQPWYQEGLCFDCTQCGNCCTGAPGYVWVNAEEIAALADRLGFDSPQAFEEQYVRRIGIRKSLREYPNGDCVFFDVERRRCSVYEQRPRQCRTWPFWNSNLKSPEAWESVCEICPGSGKGKLYSLEAIETQRGVIRV